MKCPICHPNVAITNHNDSCNKDNHIWSYQYEKKQAYLSIYQNGNVYTIGKFLDKNKGYIYIYPIVPSTSFFSQEISDYPLHKSLNVLKSYIRLLVFL